MNYNPSVVKAFLYQLLQCVTSSLFGCMTNVCLHIWGNTFHSSNKKDGVRSSKAPADGLTPTLESLCLDYLRQSKHICLALSPERSLSEWEVMRAALASNRRGSNTFWVVGQCESTAHHILTSSQQEWPDLLFHRLCGFKPTWAKKTKQGFL